MLSNESLNNKKRFTQKERVNGVKKNGSDMQCKSYQLNLKPGYAAISLLVPVDFLMKCICLLVDTYPARYEVSYHGSHTPDFATYIATLHLSSHLCLTAS